MLRQLTFKFRYLDLLLNNSLLQFCSLFLSEKFAGEPVATNSPLLVDLNLPGDQTSGFDE